MFVKKCPVSLRDANHMIKKPQTEIAIPNHSIPEGRSPMNVTAIAIVKIGALARTGAVTLSGKRETAWNVKFQLVVTIAALINSIPYSRNESEGIFPKKYAGKSETIQVKLTKKRTGKTAFFVSAFFLAISYKPKNNAESRASVTQNIAQ